MLIREGNNFLEMTTLERIPDHLPTPGDTRFEMRVRSLEFAGQGYELKFGFGFDSSVLPSIIEDFQAITSGVMEKVHAE